MNIEILSPDGTMRSVEISKAMEDHFAIPINHANTILNQINGGMYKKWFEGKKDLVCMDFGANIGLVSLYMLPACRKLFCVEPTPAYQELLQELLVSSSVSLHDKSIIFFKRALTEQEGEFVFATGHATENKISSAEGYGSHKITVTGKPLSWFVRDMTIDFCKIDVEGGEMMALTVGELKKVYGYVKTFFVEVHPGYNGSMDGNREELVKRFTEAGYRVQIEDYQTLVAYDI